jgi:hypothetical protein
MVGGLGVEWWTDSGRCTTLVDDECRIIQQNARMSKRCAPGGQESRTDVGVGESAEERGASQAAGSVGTCRLGKCPPRVATGCND